MWPLPLQALPGFIHRYERESPVNNRKNKNRVERDTLEPRIMETNWHYEGADLAKSILRMEGSKCGSPPSWLEGNPWTKIWKDCGKLWWSAANFSHT